VQAQLRASRGGPSSAIVTMGRKTVVKCESSAGADDGSVEASSASSRRATLIGSAAAAAAAAAAVGMNLGAAPAALASACATVDTAPLLCFAEVTSQAGPHTGPLFQIN